MSSHNSYHSPLRLAVLISGRGSNLDAIQKAILSNSLPAQISVVLSDKKDAHGLHIAKSYGLSTETVPRNPKQQSTEQFNEHLALAIAPYKPDIIILAGFMRILTSAFLSHWPHNHVLNIHPSLLPAFPGLRPQKQAIEAGANISGCTVHVVTEDIDAGPILAQATVPILPDDTEETLTNKILEQEHIIYPKVIAKIVTGEISLI